MLDEISLIKEDADESMIKAISHLEAELVKIRAGRATPQIVDGITVEYYGSPTPLKKAHHEGEHSRVAIRSIRRDAIEHIKKLQKDGLSEDVAKDAETNIQHITDKYIALIDKHLAQKEKEIMAV